MKKIINNDPVLQINDPVIQLAEMKNINSSSNHSTVYMLANSVDNKRYFTRTFAHH